MVDDEPGYLQCGVRDGVAVVEVLARELRQPWFAQQLGAQLRRLLSERPADRFLLDFHRTEYMSSTAFAALFDFAKAAAEAGARVAICGMSPIIRVGAEILSLDQYIPFADDEAAGLALLGAGGSAGA
jgi:anti-anti-sigma factor